MVRVTEHIVSLLGLTRGELEPMNQFEAWVSERTTRVCQSAGRGQPGLRLELAQLRSELMEVRRRAPVPLLQSEDLWLQGLIELVAEVASDERQNGSQRACA